MNEKRLEYRDNRIDAIKNEITKFEAGIKQAWEDFANLLNSMETGQKMAA